MRPGYGPTPLGQALPLILGGKDIGQATDAFWPVLTPEGDRHPIFANIGGFFPTQAGRRRRPVCRRWTAARALLGRRPGATVLATSPAEPELDARAGRATAGPRPHRRLLRRHHPQLATSPAGDGPGFALLAVLGADDSLAGGRSEEFNAAASIVASVNKVNYEPGEPIRISAVVRDKQGQGAADAKVAAKTRGPGGRPEQIDLTAEPGPPGHYGGTFEPKEPGGYEIAVQAQVGELSLAAEKLGVEVGRVNLEFEKLDLDEKTLGQIADGRRRTIRPHRHRRPPDRPARPQPAEEANLHRAAALLAAGLLGRPRRRLDLGMALAQKHQLR